MHSNEIDPPRNWKIYRDGVEVAAAAYHIQAKSIVRQLSKLHPKAEWKVKYVGKNLPHFNDGAAD